MNFEYRVRNSFPGRKRIRIGTMQLDRRPGDNANIAVDFVKKILKLARGARFIRKRPLHDNIFAGFTQRKRGRPAAEIWYRRSVEIAGDGTCEKDLVILLLHMLLIYNLELGDNCANLQALQLIQVRNIADDKVVAVEGNGVALLHQAP